MTLNEVLIRQSFLNQIVLKSDEGELPKDLKVKVMRMRIELNKVRAQFDEDSQDMIKGLKPEGFDELANKEDKTDEEIKRLQELTDKLNEEYNLYIIEKGKEEHPFDKKFTSDEYDELININVNDVIINGTKLSGEEFLEIFYTLFVE